MARGVIYVENSKNSKLGDCDTTYVGIKDSCSSTCPLKQSRTCYAMTSYTGIINRRMEKRARGANPLALARAEAKTINNCYSGGPVPNGRMLRLHTIGDSRSITGTRILAKAADRWIKRGGKYVFTYTHSWKNVNREDWGSVSVLASIESTSQVEMVRKQGFAPAIIVPQHTTDKAHSLPGSETVFIPCPAQTKDNVSCSTCQLCMKSDWLFAINRGISFAAHGVRQNSLKKQLTLIKE